MRRPRPKALCTCRNALLRQSPLRRQSAAQHFDFECLAGLHVRTCRREGGDLVRHWLEAACQRLSVTLARCPRQGIEAVGVVAGLGGEHVVVRCRRRAGPADMGEMGGGSTCTCAAPVVVPRPSWTAEVRPAWTDAFAPKVVATLRR